MSGKAARNTIKNMMTLAEQWRIDKDIAGLIYVFWNTPYKKKSI
tara:strand:+ start:313 stop:444 length:132 start_codon:yes stop_codon:yes gene_type:complete